LALTSSYRPEVVNNRTELRDCLVHLWDVTSGKELRRFAGHTGVILSLAFAPDGRRAVSLGTDRTARLWGLSGGGPPVGGVPPAEPKRPAARRLTVPGNDEQAEAEKLIKKRFETEYKKPAERGALAAKLLDMARATNDDPTGRYVLLREARDLAAQAG